MRKGHILRHELGLVDMTEATDTKTLRQFLTEYLFCSQKVFGGKKKLYEDVPDKETDAVQLLITSFLLSVLSTSSIAFFEL